MIVVAIIGVLTAIAIPNFQAFQARSRQSEAKAALTGIYTAAKSFHAKWEAYAALFEVIGYRPGGDFRYTVGWDDADSTADQIGGAGLDIDVSANCTATAMLGAGPAPGRIYTGGCAPEKEFNTETYCGGAGSCSYRGVAGVKATLTAAKLGTGATNTSVGVNMFRANAVADLQGLQTMADDVASMGDVWTVDQEKNLINIRDQVDEAF